MNPIRFRNVLVIVLAAALAATGCKNHQPPTKVIGGAASSPEPQVTDNTGGDRPISVPKDRGVRPQRVPMVDVLPPVSTVDNPPMTKATTDITPPPSDNTITNPPPEGLRATSRDDYSNFDSDPLFFKDDAIHFDFDSSRVKADEQSKVAAVADYLKSHPDEAVRVEGNCDERGTEEYNRALGERRAGALREDLFRLGVDAKRVETVSYGKDKPVAMGHDEASWRQNRRGDFVRLTPPAAK